MFHWHTFDVNSPDDTVKTIYDITIERNFLSKTRKSNYHDDERIGNVFVWKKTLTVVQKNT